MGQGPTETRWVPVNSLVRELLNRGFTVTADSENLVVLMSVDARNHPVVLPTPFDELPEELIRHVLRGLLDVDPDTVIEGALRSSQ